MCSWALDLTAIELCFEFCVFEVPHNWFGRFQGVFRLKAQLVSAISPEPVDRFQNHSIALYGTIISFIWRLLGLIRFSGHRETRLTKLRYTHTHIHTYTHTHIHTYIQTFSDLVELSRM